MLSKEREEISSMVKELVAITKPGTNEHQLGKTILMLLWEVDRLRSALEWYGDEKNWNKIDYYDYYKMCGDGGAKAREALNGKT